MSLTPETSPDMQGAQVVFEEDWNDSYTLPREEKNPEELDELSVSSKSPQTDQVPPTPEPVAPKKKMQATWQLRQAPSKRMRMETKQTQQRETKMEQKKTTSSPTHWIAQWAKDNLTPTEINCLLRKSSLVILEHEEIITTSYTSPPQKTGGITASLEKLLDAKNTNVLKLHVFVEV
ncbi:hypothetical protein B5X24_HaOG216457 [Helicoverpa armigera]|uniref:Uncharacterized protein n=1 Tax=Helicoverpa armigera TaxID=29058 RepID=A0A2W1CMV6_HELAM|nr:hypothetical protein B5X24_HaOG216457 [Helicoverpa armigera]